MTAQEKPFNFDDFYTANYSKTVLFAKSYVHDSWIAEDIASDAMITFWETSKKYRIEHPLTFLFGIVKNKSIDYLRHEAVRQERLATMSEVGLRELHSRVTALEAFEPSEIYSQEIKAIVNATMKALPNKTRKIFIMSRHNGMTYEAIAQKIQLSIKSVEYHITKALSQLRTALRDYLAVLLLLLFS